MAKSVTFNISAVDRVTNVLRKIDGSVKQSAASVTKLSSAGNALRSVTTAVAGLAAAWQSMSMIKDSVSLAADYDATVKVIGKLTDGADEAVKILTDLRKLPIRMEGLDESAKLLLAFGEDSTKVVDTARRLGDVAIYTGNRISELSELYGKARTQGTLYAEDINQLTNRGIPIIQEFAAIMGVSTGEVKKLASEGKIAFPVLEQAIRNMTNEGGKFEGGMQTMAKSAKGLAMNLQGVWTDAKRAFGENILKGFLGDTEEAVKSTKELDTLLQNLSKTAGAFVGDVAGMMKAITGLTNFGDLNRIFELALAAANRVLAAIYEITAAILGAYKVAAEFATLVPRSFEVGFRKLEQAGAKLWNKFGQDAISNLEQIKRYLQPILDGLNAIARTDFQMPAIAPFSPVVMPPDLGPTDGLIGPWREGAIEGITATQAALEESGRAAMKTAEQHEEASERMLMAYQFGDMPGMDGEMSNVLLGGDDSATSTADQPDVGGINDTIAKLTEARDLLEDKIKNLTVGSPELSAAQEQLDGITAELASATGKTGEATGKMKEFGTELAVVVGSEEDLRQKLSELQADFDRLDPGSERWHEVGAEIVATELALEDVQRQTESYTSAQRDAMNVTDGVGRTLKGIENDLAKYNEQLKNLDVASEAFTRTQQKIGELESEHAKATGEMSEGMQRFASTATSAIDQFVETGRFSIKSFAIDVIQEFAKMQIQAAAMAALFGKNYSTTGKIAGGIVGGVIGAFTKVPSADGGGYTGSGGRTGGLDGKGGFMAMLHPNETVLDHTKGQGGGTNVYQTLNIQPGMSTEMIPQILQAAQQGTMSILSEIAGRGGSRAQGMGLSR